jgi:hypothetical protein
MLDPVSLVGLAAAGMQMFQQLVELKNRILAKPDDKKTLRAIRSETQQMIKELRKYEKDLISEANLGFSNVKVVGAEAEGVSTDKGVVGDVKTASMELRDVLQDVIDDIDGLGKRGFIKNVLTCLSIYSPRFEQRLTAALRVFHVKFALQSQRKSENSLAEMTQKLDRLTINKQHLEEDLPEMTDAIALIDDRIAALRKSMDEVRTSQVMFQDAMKTYFPEMRSQIREDVRKDGDETRELVRSLCNSP